MGQPTQFSVHIDRPLTNISIAYQQEAAGFIASQVFPRIPVDKQTDLYFTYTKNDWFRDEAQLRADSSESAGSGYNIATDNYTANVFAFHKDIGEQVLANADQPLNLDREATMFVTQRLMLQLEIKWQSVFFKTGVWGTDTTVAQQWNDYIDSDPIDDVEGGKETILLNTGQRANTLVLGYQVYRKLKNHPQVIDRLKYTQGVTGRTITPQMLAAMFDLDRVLVSEAIKATNNEGATEAYGFINGKHALLLHVAPNPGLLTPSAGYIFEWTGVSQGMGANIAIARIVMPLKRATRIEGQTAYAMKVVGSDLGVFFSSVVA